MALGSGFEGGGFLKEEIGDFEGDFALEVDAETVIEEGSVAVEEAEEVRVGVGIGERGLAFVFLFVGLVAFEAGFLGFGREGLALVEEGEVGEDCHYFSPLIM